MKIAFPESKQLIAELKAKIEGLRLIQDNSAVDISKEVFRLVSKSQQLTKGLYTNLTLWRVAQIV